MRTTYQRAKDYLVRPLLGLAIIAGLGCEPRTDYHPTGPLPASRQATEQRKLMVQRTGFDDWGLIEGSQLFDVNRLTYNGDERNELEIRLGDMDGDGDLDIVVGSGTTGIRIYENRIPQKNSAR